MTLFQRRLIIALDEWLGALTCIYLHRVGSSWFWPVLVFWVIAVYGISYPAYWSREKKLEGVDTTTTSGNHLE